MSLFPFAIACSGSDTTGDDDDAQVDPTPTMQPDGVNFGGLEDGQAVSQTVDIEITSAGASGMTFLAPPELVGVDLDSAPDILAASWDTTREVNGEAQISVEIDSSSGKTTETLTVYRSNINAAIKCIFTSNTTQSTPEYLGDGDYVRSESPLLLSCTASAFGSTPSLSGVVIREVSGGGLNPTLPLNGTQDGDWYDFNVGVPEDGTIELLINAVNATGEYSEPKLLRLLVLRDDLVSLQLPYDFEISRDGQTGLLLTSNPSDLSSMRLEFVDLSDPTNPAPYPEVVSLKTGVSGSTTGSGNVVVSPTEDRAYVLFPNSTKSYAINITNRSVATEATIYTAIAPNSGAAIGHINRAPCAAITSDGKYLFAVSTAIANALVMIDTATMAQLGPEGSSQKGFTMPLGGFGLHSIHPQGNYVYLVNNWGDGEAGTGDLAVFAVETKQFLDFNLKLPEDQAKTIEYPPGSEYLVAQQPLATPDGYWLAMTFCDRSTGKTKLDLLDVSTATTAADPTVRSELNLYDQRQQIWGTPVAVSPNSQYLLIGDRDTNLLSGLVVDLMTNRVVSGAYFDAGVSDGVFSIDSTKVFTLASSWTSREMTMVDLALASPEPVVVKIPGGTGLAPPASVDDVRNNLIVRSGNYVYVIIPAETIDGNGYSQALGTSMSVYDVTAGKFVFPTPLGS